MIKHLLLFISIVLFLWVFFRLVSQKLYRFEGFATNPPGICLNSLYDDLTNLPLREYMIKSSYNSAYDDGKVSADNLVKRIQAGDRFIDLDLYTVSGGTYVGYSANNDPTLVDASLPLADALKIIQSQAFHKVANGNSQAMFDYTNYPIFVHLRVYRPPDSSLNIVDNIWTDIQRQGIPNLLTQQKKGEKDKTPVLIDGCTLLGDIGQKIIFCMDIGNLIQIYAPASDPSIKYLPASTLQKFVNIYTGGGIWRAFYAYKELDVVTKQLRIEDPTSIQPYHTNVSNMYIVYPYPEEDDSNPDWKNMVLYHSIQTIPMRSYLVDSNSTSYETMFTTLKTPFVCMSFAYNYIRNLTSSDMGAKK